ncbi:MAG: universal stress protein [Candidatus Thermoplasmatota archaeon]|nr:universal stress protein [Candidatus Thermoplasmatota archaeon]
MFQNILIPVSSEHYSKQIVYRSIQLAEYFKSTVTLLYIIEERTMDQTDMLTDSYRTYYDRMETQEDFMKKQQLNATQVIFDFASHLFEQKGIAFNHYILYGEFSDLILKEIKKRRYDLVLMGYEKQCIFHSRLIKEITVPLWIEINKKHKPRILGVCSNLAPNELLPSVSDELSKALNWEMLLYYIIDKSDPIIVDKKGKRSEKKTLSELQQESKRFIEDIQKQQVTIETNIGGLEQEILKKAKKYDPALIIIGKEQKRRGSFGLPYGDIKRKLVQKCKYSLLFIK